MTENTLDAPNTEEPKPHKLTDKQKAFIEEYLIDLNATQAAIRAGYSQESAKEIGYENLTKLYVQEAIKAAQEARSKRTEITADRVLQELAKLAFSNIEDYTRIDDEGLAQVNLSDLTRDQFAAINEITVDTRHDKAGDEKTSEVEKVKFKLADKGLNLERLGRHLKLFTDKREIDTNFNLTIESKDADCA